MHVKNSFRLFAVGGIDVNIHISWLVVFALLTWSLAVGYFPTVIRGLEPAAAWILAAVATLLLFASVLVHELSHSFVARARGLQVDSITLFIFGGVSNLTTEPRDARTEFLVAVVGPIASFVIGAVALGITVLLTDERLAALFGYLAVVNGLLGGFNLIPGFPLDGGRVLRSIAWGITHSLRRATEIAVGAGQIVGGLFILWGIVQVFSGNLVNGLWIAAIGWFLQNAASSSLRQVVLEERLRDVPVHAVMNPDTTSVLPGTTVAELIEQHFLARNRRAMPVTDNGRLVGIVTLGDISQVPVEARERTTVAEVMGGRDGLVTVRPTDTLDHAIEALSRGDLEQVPVLDGRELVGMLSRASVMRQLQIRETLDVDAESTPEQRSARA